MLATMEPPRADVRMPRRVVTLDDIRHGRVNTVKVSELARILGVSREKIHADRRLGHLRAIKGRRATDIVHFVLFTCDEARRYLTEVGLIE